MSPTPPETVIIEVLRAEDSLRLRISFVNFILVEGPVLVRADAAQAGFVVVELPPQHLAETTFWEGTPLGLPAPARLAGSTRLAFRVPDAVTEIPVTLDALLDWDAWTPSVVPAALPLGPPPPGAPPALRPPGERETAIELPYRVLLSPDASARWTHASRPVERRRRVELWHTRMTGPVRAVWSPDFRADPLPIPPDDATFRTTLTPSDRHELVHQSANYALSGRTPEQTAPVDATIMLSSTGGWLHGHGAWPVTPESPLGLSEWEHHTAEGRDHYVRKVYEGVVLPFGHRAALVEISERTVETAADDDPVAALRSRALIVLREPERAYSPGDYDHDGREFPFARRVRFTTLVTPDLDPPQIEPGFQRTFWVRRGNDYLQFALEGADQDGRLTPFHAPCLFVGQEDLQAGMMAAATRYLDPAQAAGRVARLDGHRVAFTPAPAGAAAGGQSDLATDEIALSVQAGGARTWPGAVPSMANATVRVPALSELGRPTGTTIELDPTYLAQGFTPGANPLELFARAKPIPFEFPADRSAGLATPSMDVDGLSRLRGPVGDVAGLASGTFDPASFFGDAKLLGGVKLADLVATVFDPGQLPRMVSERLPPGAAVPDALVTSVDWTPAVVPNPVVTWQAPPPGTPSLELHARAERRSSGATSATVDATLRAFTLTIPSTATPYVGIAFAELRCELPQGGKPHVTAALVAEPLTFDGPLAFVNELREYLPSDGFSDPPALDLTPSGLDIGYVLSLPAISVGVFNLQDLSLGASLHLPFTGEPARLRVAFSERAHPCVLTVSLFGGGAFLAIAGGADGIEMIEGAIEFGGSFALDIVVASGGVTVMAGVYFKYEPSGSPALTLAGYFRASGEVSVLGLISVSVDFMLTLTWEDTGKVTGEATLTVKVEIAFFSTSVGLRLRKGFGGASGDPTFGDLMADQTDWDAYTAAFA